MLGSCRREYTHFCTGIDEKLVASGASVMVMQNRWLQAHTETVFTGGFTFDHQHLRLPMWHYLANLSKLLTRKTYILTDLFIPITPCSTMLGSWNSLLRPKRPWLPAIFQMTHSTIINMLQVHVCPTPQALEQTIVVLHCIKWVWLQGVWLNFMNPLPAYGSRLLVRPTTLVVVIVAGLVI